jgi:uncharacterized protein YggT (Ycf19 family)
MASHVAATGLRAALPPSTSSSRRPVAVPCGHGGRGPRLVVTASARAPGRGEAEARTEPAPTPSSAPAPADLATTIPPPPSSSAATTAAGLAAALLLLTSASPALADAADPAATASAASTATTLLRPFFALSELAFVVRIVMTWYPGVDASALPWSLVYGPTEPLLAPTRRAVPPVGGVDVSPIIWFALTSLANEILVGPQGILVLLSRKVGGA